MQKSTNRLRNIYRRTCNERDGQEWRNIRDEYRHMIKRAKETLWKEFVGKADERTIWTVKKYIDTKPTPYYIPTINNAMSNDEKAAEFTATFFPTSASRLGRHRLSNLPGTSANKHRHHLSTARKSSPQNVSQQSPRP